MRDVGSYIGIDASRMAISVRTGTEHYTYELISALGQIDRQQRYMLYCNQLPQQLPPLPPTFDLCHIPFPRLWTHARFSAELVQHPPASLFVPAHVLPVVTPLLRRTRKVVTIHDLGYLHFPEAHTRNQRLLLRLTTAWSTRVADAVIAISQATKQDLITLARVPDAKIHVIGHGVSPRFCPADPAAMAYVRERYQIGADRYLLYVGTVQPRKNLVRLLEAFARTNIGEQLVIVGKIGWLSGPIAKRVAELGLDQRVRFLGYVPDADLPALLSGAVAFVFPSLYEGFGMPVLEAMACGVPVLTSQTSSLPEVAGGAALLVDPTDTGQIAQQLERLSQDADLRADLRERGLVRAAQATWQQTARTTLQVLLPR
ncbi:MAG: glycosyltransferase family 1 protein [Roseiflexaceae bacterium]